MIRLYETRKVTRYYSSGRVAKTTGDRYTKITTEKNCRITVVKLAQGIQTSESTRLSRQTVTRRLHHVGWFVRKPVRFIPLSISDEKKRYECCREHVNWSDQQ
ncbi:hypothetical protein AVEN_98950-1 [Araneus ventricosus]|uniref:Transposase Tc1-like domain-containing protein n=1 Tax=Araneus ventricosus TaxID=182803 RepID=A0A4Y2F429_ARAVE|nr:hypothetical protein AVEN_98950-1 [Araneus ventricosus]